MRPILDRIARFDERSREWGIRKLQPGEPRSYTWDCDTNLNQGNEGACVGFGWAQEAAARPVLSTLLACSRSARTSRPYRKWAFS